MRQFPKNKKVWSGTRREPGKRGASFPHPPEPGNRFPDHAPRRKPGRGTPGAPSPREPWRQDLSRTSPLRGSRHAPSPRPPEPQARVSLTRALSKLGYCSRNQAVSVIQEHEVSVNGVPTRDPNHRLDLGRDQIAVDGVPVTRPRFVYLALNKPRGLVTTRSDEKDRPTVYDCLREENLPWIAPVGRLDRASEGLLLFTNDTGWAARLCDPVSHLDKTYHVQIDRIADPALLNALRAGIKLSDEETLGVKKVGVLRTGTSTSWLEIILDEGKNRQIRRILEALGVQVLRLVRVAIGPLALGDLAKGTFRHLTETERHELTALTRRKPHRP